jgi:hypothetical protein
MSLAIRELEYTKAYILVQLEKFKEECAINLDIRFTGHEKQEIIDIQKIIDLLDKIEFTEVD